MPPTHQQDMRVEAQINRVRILVILLLLGLSAISHWIRGPEHHYTFVLESLAGLAALSYSLLIDRLCRRSVGAWLMYFAVTADFTFIAAIIAIHGYTGEVSVLGTLEFYHGLLDTAFLLVFVENSLSALRLDEGVAIYCAVLGSLLTLAIGLYSSYILGLPGSLVDTIMRLLFVVCTALIPIAGMRRSGRMKGE